MDRAGARRFRAVKLLVDELKADVNAINDRHETALHGAVCRGADSVIQYLVDKGAKLDVKDVEGKTAARCRPERYLHEGIPLVLPR